MTLLQETISVMQWAAKRTDDVAWVGSRDGKYAITWNEFTDLADKEYDNDGYTPWVAMDLVIVGKSGWFMERDVDYDRGGESWSLHTFPKKSANPMPVLVRLLRTKHENQGTLEDLNDAAGLKELRRAELLDGKEGLSKAIAELRKVERTLGHNTPEEITNALRDLEDKKRYIEEELDYE